MKVRFTARADNDIIESYLYGQATFGAAQAERYEQSLREAVDLIAENPRLAAERQEYDPPVRIHHHGRHYIIYLIGDDHISIVRILRDEMDLVARLGGGGR